MEIAGSDEDRCPYCFQCWFGFHACSTTDLREVVTAQARVIRKQHKVIRRYKKGK